MGDSMKLLFKMPAYIKLVYAAAPLSNKKGQSMVETAVILPVIILILMAIIEFGRIFNTYLIITNVSREGARCAVVGGTDAAVISTINNSASTLDKSEMSVTISPSEKI